MKTATILVFLASVEGILGACDDACASAVTEIDVPLALTARSSDCAHFLEVTVTPSTSYAYITTSVDSNDFGHADLPSRTPVIPPYATACAAENDYASACSCASVATPTATAPTLVIYEFDNLPHCVNAGTCESGYDGATCGNGCGFCVPDVGGDGTSGFCVAGGFCQVNCTVAADCDSGICLDSTCCGRTCFTPDPDPTAPGLCTSWAPPPTKKRSGVFGGMLNKFMGRDVVEGQMLDKRRPSFFHKGESIFGTFVPDPPTVPSGFPIF